MGDIIDLTIKHNELMVGSGHPTLADTLNRLHLVEHNIDGTHKNPNVLGEMLFHSEGFVQPFTSLLLPSDVYGYLGIEAFFNPGVGGALLGGISNADAPAVTILSLVGTTGSISTAAIEIVAAKSNGSNGMVAISDTDELFKLTNYNRPDIFHVFGNGNVQTVGKFSGSKMNLLSLEIYANNAAALASGLVAGDCYRTGGDPDLLCIVH